MNRVELEKRTKQFALKTIQFAATLPKSKVGDVITYQLVKAGTSVGANYREANRAESQYWLELCEEATLGNTEQRQWLLQESGELLAIFTSAGRTAKSARAARV